MDLNQIKITQLLKSDLPNILHLQPEGWNDIRKVFLQFMGYDFFYPVKAVFENKIIGIGEVLFNGDTAWIGVIVVDKSLRNKGIGSFITNFLSKYISSKNIPTQMLLATPLGQPVYEKLGFRHVSDYVFLRREKTENGKGRMEKGGWEREGGNGKIIQYDPQYFAQVAALDKLAIGEDRSQILQYFTDDALLFIDQSLKGFYLPHLGDGLIIATDHEAGFELLRIKWATKSELIILPQENKEIIEFAESQGFKPYRYAARMILGKNFDWNPRMIYNRVGGYLG